MPHPQSDRNLGNLTERHTGERTANLLKRTAIPSICPLEGFIRATIFGRRFPEERRTRAIKPMGLAQGINRIKPQARELACGLGVSDGARGHPEVFLEDIFAKRLDNAGSGLFGHETTMPNSLAYRKPNECGLRQETWRSNICSMQNDEKPYADIAERLKWHRSFEGLEQKAYAERAGLKRGQLSNWETGDYRLSLDGARALRKTYGLSLDFIYEGIPDALPMTLRAAWLSRS